MRRMTLDRCLPSFLLHLNPLTKTCWLIIVGFFLVTSSLYAITLGTFLVLAQSFLFVCLFLSPSICLILPNYIRERQHIRGSIHGSFLVCNVVVCCWQHPAQIQEVCISF